jgi:hypothetical protein
MEGGESVCPKETTLKERTWRGLRDEESERTH